MTSDALTPEALDTIEAELTGPLIEFLDSSDYMHMSTTGYGPSEADKKIRAAVARIPSVFEELRRLRTENEEQREAIARHVHGSRKDYDRITTLLAANKSNTARINGVVADYEEQCRRADNAEEACDALQAKIDHINDLLGSLDLSGKTIREGTAWGSILRETLALSSRAALTGEATE